MSDWVPASRRTLWYAGGASLLWLGGVVAGLSAARVNDAVDVTCDVLLLTMLGVSIAMITWAALQCAPRSRLRVGWLLASAALIVAFASSVIMVLVSWQSPQSPFDGAAPGITLGFLAGGIGLAIAASSVGRVGSRLVPFLQALGLSVSMFLVMVGALLAPGPTMPFAVGPRDVLAVFRLLIDCGLLLLPTAYATLAQLRLPNAHRARSWIWASAGALVLAMGEVGAPLVDLDSGQLYPIMLWGLGIVLIGVAASLTADFELAERGEADAASPTLVSQANAVRPIR